MKAHGRRGATVRSKYWAYNNPTETTSGEIETAIEGIQRVLQLTDEQLAEKIQVSERTFQRMKSGTLTQPKAFARLARFAASVMRSQERR